MNPWTPAALVTGLAIGGIVGYGFTAQANKTPTKPVAQQEVALPPKVDQIKPGPPNYPQGTYAVPEEMPYGTYTAGLGHPMLPGDTTYPAPTCTYIFYAPDGEPIDMGADTQGSRIARIHHGVAAFQTYGCTPWVQVIPKA